MHLEPAFRVESALTIGDKIGEGQHREVFRSGQMALKVQKLYRERTTLGFTTRIPMRDYSRRKFGIKDFNRLELENYRRLADFVPVALRRHFCVIHWAGEWRGRSISLSDLILNEDGTCAQPLSQFGTMADPQFWTAFGCMESFLIDSRMFFLGLNSDNILVQMTRDGPLPIMVDYKWLGPRAYRWQFWLRWEAGLKRKLHRKFGRIRELYGPELRILEDTQKLS